MNKPFKLKIVTLREILEREITYLKISDESGYFGIMANHIDFLTVIEPGLGTYKTPDGKTHYFAVDGGFLLVEKGEVILSVYEFFEGKSPEDLSKLISETIKKRKEIEERYRKLITEIEETFLKRALQVYTT